MNYLSSYCGLVDAKKRASGKDLPVHSSTQLDLHSARKSRSNFVALAVLVHNIILYVHHYVQKNEKKCSNCNDLKISNRHSHIVAKKLIISLLDF